ncbi:sigma 54-interacting transcriptional regulator [Desulfomonile tiedjei]|uniref:HTH-type transcriptional regulatory protein TyrR n=1 Tax=Desulfomonile tiedjei (strain ATCC 49306 / DSM 6799 / DCB-1) TaxID=706587 RepID=I4C421_DESTA|nr:sigma 54-interacting transcriptional regulator [Desulfomonile tiedjei]AFM24312.1 PAS domain S-box [Desulfomonile tiedjei DSM 6799]
MERMSHIPDTVRALIDAIHNPIIAIDAQGTIAMCNSAAESMLGHTREQVYGKRLDSYLETSELHRILETGQGELVRRLSIGSKAYVSNRTPVRINGETIGAVAVLQDISELEAISSELEHTRLISEQLNAIIESSFDGIYVTDGQARTLKVNAAYERITGLRREDVLGRTMMDLVKEGFYDESVTIRVLETGKPQSILQTIKTGKTVMVTGTPFLDKEGKTMLVVTNVRDVTELNLLQKKLENMHKLQSEAKIELEQLKESRRGGVRLSLRSKSMQEILQLGLRLSHVDSTVLVEGESGVGKEVFADIIHNSGPRQGNPFIKISCGAIPDQLLESELFGYVSGAFTGARKQGKAGLFEVADGGTIFLDEIGEMPLGLQVKLLRVLQERTITRVGDTVPIKVDVRVIAATNRNLAGMAQVGQFRKDLYYRLNVVPVRIPPLRERKEDIIDLVYRFLDSCNKRYGFSKQIDREVLNVLMDYEWPGNVRELENVMEQMVVVTQGEVITMDDLPSQLKRAMEGTQVLPVEDKPLKTVLEEVERRSLELAYRKHKTTRAVAKILGINQSTVVRKMRQYGIRPIGIAQGDAL